MTTSCSVQLKTDRKWYIEHERAKDIVPLVAHRCLQHGVIMEEEYDCIMSKNGCDRTRCIVDLVRMKGDRASEVFVTGWGHAEIVGSITRKADATQPKELRPALMKLMTSLPTSDILELRNKINRLSTSDWFESDDSAARLEQQDIDRLVSSIIADYQTKAPLVLDLVLNKVISQELKVVTLHVAHERVPVVVFAANTAKICSIDRRLILNAALETLNGISTDNIKILQWYLQMSTDRVMDRIDVINTLLSCVSNDIVQFTEQMYNAIGKSVGMGDAYQFKDRVLSTEAPVAPVLAM